MAGHKITTRDVDIFRDLGRLQLLSTRQIWQLHFGGASMEAAANRMRKLVSANLVKRLYAPLSAQETQAASRPMAIWLFPPDCQKKVAKQLMDTNRASDWEEISANLETYNKSQRFAQQSLIHETALSDVFIARERAGQGRADFENLLALRTSPRHPDFTRKVKVTRERLSKDKNGKMKAKTFTRQQPVNPDGFLVDRAGGKFFFTFVELDNDSSKVSTHFEKLEGYYVYLKEGHFGEVVELFSHRYHWGIKNPHKAAFQVLTVVNSGVNAEKRRDDLYAASLPLPTETFFNFTTLSDYVQDPLGAVMLNKSVFRPLESMWRKHVKGASPVAQRKWFSEHLPSLEKTVQIPVAL